MHVYFPIYPTFYKSNKANILIISSFVNTPDLKPLAFLIYNYSLRNSLTFVGFLKHTAVHKSSINSIILCFYKY